MARRRSFIAVLGAVAIGLLPAPSGAQEKEPFERRARPELPRRPLPRLGPEAEVLRERAVSELQKLSPEQRGEVWRAVWAVLNLPPEKRRMVLGFDDDRRKKAREEIESAMEESGVQLDEPRKRAFMQRYFEERKAVEERLRKESDEKRRQLVLEMKERLGKEFGPRPVPAVSRGDGGKQ